MGIACQLEGETLMQKKTMIYLDEDTHLRFKSLALDQGVSMAELIRRAVAEYLKTQPSRKRGPC
jgi:predicted HicB family RNase H-like nuclease